MSHQTICHQCHNRNGRTPKRWEWLCAEWHADKHRTETGHQIELRITTEPTITDLQQDIRTLRLTQRRGGW